MSTYTAHFTPEAWANDQAVQVDAEGPTKWNCTRAVNQDIDYFDRMASALRGGWDNPTGALDRDDFLKYDFDAPEWVREWVGPFTIRVRRDEEVTA